MNGILTSRKYFIAQESKGWLGGKAGFEIISEKGFWKKKEYFLRQFSV